MATKTSITDTKEPRPALIFIPDISGFTEFVTYTEIDHSRHIIEELLEILIAANQIGLEVSEIEGDAILFYRFGDAPSAEELLDQVKKMFSNFHVHLKKYESHRVCNCGACRTASNLAIKFIAHYGDITINTIRQHKKLFGKEVIVAHRLLKNDIDSHEYSLFTDPLMAANQSWKNVESKAWSQIVTAEKEYDSGRIRFSYLFLDPLMKQLPEIPPEDYALQGGKSRMLSVAYTINAPIDLVFNVVSDLPFRSKWIPDTMVNITDINSQLAQAGQTHRCIANGPIMVGHDYHREKGTISFTETVTNKAHCVVYTLSELNPRQTRVTSTLFIPKHPVKAFMFNLLMKKKIKKMFDDSYFNLISYCNGLAERGEQHPYSILFQEEKVPIMV